MHALSHFKRQETLMMPRVLGDFVGLDVHVAGAFAALKAHDLVEIMQHHVATP